MRVCVPLLLVCLPLVASLSDADGQKLEIVGVAECTDCLHNNFKTSQAFSGLHVSIHCKLKSGEMKRVGESPLDEGGKFKISVPNAQILKKECYAQLHNAAATPCAAHDGAKILFKSKTHNKITFTTQKSLPFSTDLCTSKFLWPFFEYPPLPETDPWKKTWPKISIPPLKSFGYPWSTSPPYKPKHKLKPVPFDKPKPESPVFKPLPPTEPIYEPPTKPFPPPVPIYKPMPPSEPIYKPLPPKVPIDKPPVVKQLPPKVPIYRPPVVKPLPPPVPIYKPLPPPVPIYKSPVVKPLPPPSPIYKPLPPSVPMYKPPVVKPLPPPVPIYKPLPPPVPIYEPPVVKPLPSPVPIYEPLPPPFPLFPLPPLKKKPCPPFTKIPPKYFKHPKFGYSPKLPPFNSSP